MILQRYIKDTPKEEIKINQHFLITFQVPGTPTPSLSFHCHLVPVSRARCHSASPVWR